MANENNVQLEQILIEIQAYVEQLNKTLENTTREMSQTKEDMEEIITLAGELDAYFKQ